MTDESDAPLPDDVVRLLADDETWTDLDAEVTESAIAAVLAEVELANGSAPEAASTVPAPEVVRLDERRTTRWRDVALGAAAALVLFIGGFALVRTLAASDDDAGTVVALAPTDLEPDAAGQARIETTPDGTRILLDVTGLPPAAPGEYYEAWLRTGPEVGVSAGTFHLRGGGTQTIELWAGVVVDDYPLFTI